MKPQNIVIDERLKAFIIETEETTQYRQLVFRFPNDYGASVVTGAGGNGIEMARILFMYKVFMYKGHSEFVICEEPFGWLTNEELNTMLFNIKETGYAKGEEK